MTDQNLARAAELASLIERLHGATHPELTRVRAEITLALQQSGNETRTIELSNELRTLTQNCALPNDACEAFEATHQALERADRQHGA